MLSKVSREPHIVRLPTHLPCVAQSEEDVRRILVHYNRNKRNLPWMAKVPVEELSNFVIRPVHTVAYTLHTMWESRKLVTMQEPSAPPASVVVNVNFFDQSPRSRPKGVLSAWKVKLPSQPQPFVPGETRFEIPGTSLIVVCETCVGTGKTRCITCKGSGKVVCQGCWGGMKVDSVDKKVCKYCGDAGSVDCRSCDSGKVICKVCRGLQFVRESTWMEVAWWVVSSTPFVAKKVSLRWKAISSGDLKKAERRTEGVFFVEDSSAGEARDLIVQGQSFFGGVTQEGREEREEQLMGESGKEKVVAFRQTLKAIPLVEVDVEHQGNVTGLFILGNDHKVRWVGGFPRSFGSNRNSCSIV